MADGVDKPEHFSSIAGSFNIATAGSHFRNNKIVIKDLNISISPWIINSNSWKLFVVQCESTLVRD